MPGCSTAQPPTCRPAETPSARPLFNRALASAHNLAGDLRALREHERTREIEEWVRSLGRT